MVWVGHGVGDDVWDDVWECRWIVCCIIVYWDGCVTMVGLLGSNLGWGWAGKEGLGAWCQEKKKADACGAKHS